MTTFDTTTAGAREVAADLLIVPVFTGQDRGPGIKDTRLGDAYAAARLTGKKGENLLVTKREGDRFAAGAVLLAGVGAKENFDVVAMRRALAKAVAGARTFPRVATTFAAGFGAKQAPEAVQAAIEALALGLLPVRPLQDREGRARSQAGHRGRAGALGRQGGQGRGEDRLDRRGRDVLGARSGQHARGRASPGGAGQAGPGDGQAGRAHLQDLERSTASPGRVQRRARRRPGVGEPSPHDRAQLSGEADARRRSGSSARASPSTPAASRSRTPATWSG